jgi:hypothetical protein
LPKRKPDQVTNIRLELQDHERKILNNYLIAQSLNGFMEGFDKLTSFENLYIVVTVIELVTGEEILPGTPNDVYAIIDALRTWNPSETFRWFVGEGFDIADVITDAAAAIANPFKEFDEYRGD